MIYYTCLVASCYKFQNNIVFLSEVFFTLTNNVDSDEMPNIWAFAVFKRWQLVSLPELLLWPSGPSPIIFQFLASLVVSRHYSKRRQNGPACASGGMSVNGCFREHTSSDFI